MAFLVEHRSLADTPHTTNTTLRSPPPQQRSKSSGTMKVVSAFRRGNGPVSDSRSPPTSRRTSAAEPERRSSLTTLPLRLRRRKTSKTNEWNEEEEQAASQLGQLFFSLPSEILTPIISYLDIQDIYHLRQASQATSIILNHNASTIIRSMLPQIIPAECLLHVYTLYPISSQCQSLTHLLQISHRQKTIDRTIYHTLSFIQMRIYMLTPQTQNGTPQLPPNRLRLMTALQTPAWTVYHFLESFRKILTTTHDTQHAPSIGKFWTCPLCKTAAHDLVNSYPTPSLLGAYHFYQLLLTHLRAATRAPTYAGTIERKLRGWGKNPASDEDLSILVVLGNMNLLSRISMMQGSYDTRLRTISTFIDKINYHVDVNTNLRGPHYNRTNNITTTQDEITDPTTSLSPPFETLKTDHLDRIPGLSEFFFPIWEERILREKLVESEDELENPFVWVQRVMSGEDEEGGMMEDGHGLGLGLGQGQVTITPPPVLSLTPLPYYGAPPV